MDTDTDSDCDDLDEEFTNLLAPSVDYKIPIADYSKCYQSHITITQQFDDKYRSITGDGLKIKLKTEKFNLEKIIKEILYYTDSKMVFNEDLGFPLFSFIEVNERGVYLQRTCTYSEVSFEEQLLDLKQPYCISFGASIQHLVVMAFIYLRNSGYYFDADIPQHDVVGMVTNMKVSKYWKNKYMDMLNTYIYKNEYYKDYNKIVFQNMYNVYKSTKEMLKHVNNRFEDFMKDQKEFNNYFQRLHGLSSKGDFYRIFDL